MAAWKYCGMADVCCKESKDHEYCLHSRSMRLLGKNANALGRQLPAKTGSSLPFSPISDKEPPDFSLAHSLLLLLGESHINESTQCLGTLGVVDEIARKSVWHPRESLGGQKSENGIDLSKHCKC